MANWERFQERVAIGVLVFVVWVALPAAVGAWLLLRHWGYF